MVTHIRKFTRLGRVTLRLLSFTSATLVWCATAHAQLVTESNISDAIFGRQAFTLEEFITLDLNDDGVIDIADLTLHKMSAGALPPSVSFGDARLKVFEGKGAFEVEVVCNRMLPEAMTVDFVLSGTATYGSGNDYTVDSYDISAGQGSVIIPMGADRATFTVSILDDSEFDEGVEAIDFRLIGGSESTYFLGERQLSTVYIEDNDVTWNVAIYSARTEAFESFTLEMTQSDGIFDGRVLADKKMIEAPKVGDPNASGTDGWDARMFASAGALRIEFGPIPIDGSLSLFQIDRSVNYVIDIQPGLENYTFEPLRLFAGKATTYVTPVRDRLGEFDQQHGYLAYTRENDVVMTRFLSRVVEDDEPIAKGER